MEMGTTKSGAVHEKEGGWLSEETSGDVAPGTPHPLCRAQMLLAGGWRPLAAGSWTISQRHSLRGWVEPHCSFLRASREHLGRMRALHRCSV